MKTVSESIDIAAPIEQVFELLADHEGYGRMPGIGRARLLEEGAPERNGAGALRELGGAGVSFRERVTAFSPPDWFEYRIEGGTLPLEHDGGRVQLTTDGATTRVVWTTTFRLSAPLVGGALTAVVGFLIGRSFRTMLRWVKHTAERT